MYIAAQCLYRVCDCEYFHRFGLILIVRFSLYIIITMWMAFLSPITATNGYLNISIVCGYFPFFWTLFCCCFPISMDVFIWRISHVFDRVFAFCLLSFYSFDCCFTFILYTWLFPFGLFLSRFFFVFRLSRLVSLSLSSH